MTIKKLEKEMLNAMKIQVVDIMEGLNIPIDTAIKVLCEAMKRNIVSNEIYEMCKYIHEKQTFLK